LKPKILIDSIALLTPLTGIGRYTYEISKELAKNNAIEYHYYYGYISKNLNGTEKKTAIKKFKKVLTYLGPLKKIIRKIITLSASLTRTRYNLYWQPNFIPNDGIKAKKIITSVHDFSFILHKDFHPKERIEYFEKNFFKNIVKSDAIITGSHYSKQEILERIPSFKDADVHVIYHGIDHSLFRVYNDLDLPFDLPNKFILSVGSIEPRKNLLGLLYAYEQLDQKLKDEYKLILVGFKGWENQDIMEVIERNQENIIYLGFISDEELAKVYNLATAFVFPSFYEGFGLPVIEAFACGTPVVTSDRTSLPEVGGDAVLYCNPDDSHDIANKISKLLLDSDLQEQLRQKGLERAKLFSWKKSAQEHEKLFLSLL
jgi:glycosyltransferase involved in cell wall biosynthesis